MKGNQTSHNLRVIQDALQSRGTPVSDEVCLPILKELGEYVMNWISTKTYTYTDRTYNLTDSTGCAIYKDGVLTEFKYYPRKQATKRGRYTYHKQRYEFDGRELLTEALAGKPLENMGKYTLVVISKAPYGVWVNESKGNGPDNKAGKGWFDELKSDTTDKFNELLIKYGVNGNR